MTKKGDGYIGCDIKVLPDHQWIEAAQTSIKINQAAGPTEARDLFGPAPPSPGWIPTEAR